MSTIAVQFEEKPEAYALQVDVRGSGPSGDPIVEYQLG